VGNRFHYVTETVTGVGVLDKGVAILDVVERRPVGASELARAIGLSVSTAHRLANAMVTHGLLSRDDTGVYRLGRRFVTSALVELSRPILLDLRDRTGESAQLWVRRGDHRLCVASIESPAELRAFLPVGTLLPLPLGSAAHALMDSAEVREQGWAETIGERATGVASISAPIRVRGELVAALCLSGPLDRFGTHPSARYAEVVVTAAHHISTAMH
jgi:DNA-binding IclR family transcriptional regulator